MERVFISYSRRNKNFAERIARDLSDAGMDVWVDFRQIHAGEMWEKEIIRGLERSAIVVACLSPAFLASEWCTREANMARDQKKLIIPIMVVDSQQGLADSVDLNWLLAVQFINFEGRYEAAFPELLNALPGKRRVNVFDDIPVENIPNPFKGLESFQQTDAAFFFGRENLVQKAVKQLQEAQKARFLPVLGASGSGKSSLVRAGIIPRIRQGAIPGSEKWRLAIFTPGEHPVEALAVRLSPLLEDRDAAAIETALDDTHNSLHELTEEILSGTSPEVRLVLVVDQFEEVFTRSGERETEWFLQLLHHAATVPDGRTMIVITMRADFFDRLGRFPQIAELFEQEHMVIVTEMSSANLLRTIEGPASAVGLEYEDGLSARILDDVRRQPGSLPLLQHALNLLYARRSGRLLTHAAYDEIGGVQKALARHAESVYAGLGQAQQDVVRRVLLRLVEVSEAGEATRRRVIREEMRFTGVSDATVQEVIELLTAPNVRLLIASREIAASDEFDAAPVTRLEVCHEALIREWERFKNWIADDEANLRFSTEMLKAAADWQNSKRDPAYLLSGSRLLRAEEWLSIADVSAAQREFIRASIERQEQIEAEKSAQAERELGLQRTAATRLRILAVVLVAALGVAIVLTVFALQAQREAADAAQRAEQAAAEAIANEQRAAENAAQARSFALAANAERSLANDEGDLAVALAVDSAL
ncbi:MAG TPA: toll/interleukin-1 receptor domain-containing protein, partial [Aggregatilineales bacterium]|nr:toll/interleukin-1 receptor domain-containing protein [Aggregatilineales bacterium]